MKRWTFAAAIVLVVILAATASAQPGLVRVLVNGKDLVSDAPAQIVNDRTMIPLRAVSETMGWKVDWESATRTAVVQDPSRMTEDTYKRVLNGAVIFALSQMKKNSTILNDISTKEDLAKAFHEMEQRRCLMIGFMRLRPPVQYQEAHVLMGATLMNMNMSLVAMLQMKDILLNAEKYPAAEGIALGQAANVRGKAATAATLEAFQELHRLIPELNDARKLSSDEDRDWFLNTVYSMYPEGWQN
ncbi:MAG: copper amine oxidase N-terminal domain-containing protein [Ignavibacteriales bacterium]